MTTEPQVQKALQEMMAHGAIKGSLESPVPQGKRARREHEETLVHKEMQGQ